MDVYEAVATRRAVRGFTDEPVSREVIERVLSTAARSPSGSNIQPWNIYVVTGGDLLELRQRLAVTIAIIMMNAYNRMAISFRSVPAAAT